MENKTDSVASATLDAAKTQKNKRRPWGILKNDSFPWRFVLLIWVMGFLLLALNGFLLYRELRGDFMGLVAASGLPSMRLAELKDQFDFVVFRAAIVTLFYGILVNLLAVIFAHHASGPVYALKRVIREIRAGKKSRLKLRSGDYFQELAQEFNQLMDEIEQAPTDN